MLLVVEQRLLKEIGNPPTSKLPSSSRKNHRKSTKIRDYYLWLASVQTAPEACADQKAQKAPALQAAQACLTFRQPQASKPPAKAKMPQNDEKPKLKPPPPIHPVNQYHNMPSCPLYGLPLNHGSWRVPEHCMETTGDTEFSGPVAVVADPANALYAFHDDVELEAQTTVAKAPTCIH